MAVATANATRLNRCACTDALGNYRLQDADLFAPAGSTIVQDRTYVDGLGRKVTVRSISPVKPSSQVRVLTTQDPLLGTSQINILRQNKSNLGLDYALDAPGTQVIGVTRTRTLSPIVKRTVVTKLTQPEDEYYQLGSTTRDARFADKVISVGGRRPTSVVTVT